MSASSDESQDSNSAGDSEPWNSEDNHDDDDDDEQNSGAAAEASGSDTPSAARSAEPSDGSDVSAASAVIREEPAAHQDGAPSADAAKSVDEISAAALAASAEAKEPELELTKAAFAEAAAGDSAEPDIFVLTASSSTTVIATSSPSDALEPSVEVVVIEQSAIELSSSITVSAESLNDASSIGSVSANAGAPAAAVPSPAESSPSSSSAAALAMLLSPAPLPSAAHRWNNLLAQQQQHPGQHQQQSDPVFLEGVLNSLQLHGAHGAPGTHSAAYALAGGLGGVPGWPSAMMHLPSPQPQLSPEQLLQRQQQGHAYADNTLPLTERNLAQHTASMLISSGDDSYEDESGHEHDYHACLDSDDDESFTGDSAAARADRPPPRTRARSCSCSCSDCSAQDDDQEDAESDCSCVCSLGGDCLCCQNEPGEENDASLALLDANEALCDLQPGGRVGTAPGAGSSSSVASAQVALLAASWLLPKVLPFFYKLLGLNWATVPPLMFRSLEQ